MCELERGVHDVYAHMGKIVDFYCKMVQAGVSRVSRMRTVVGETENVRSKSLGKHNFYEIVVARVSTTQHSGFVFDE